MRSSSRKAKGRRLQKEVMEKLLSTFRELEEDDVTSRSMGASGEDVLLSPKARAVFPFSVECKNQERLSIWKGMKQAKSNCGDHYPLLVFTRNREDTYACLRFDDLLELLGD